MADLQIIHGDSPTPPGDADFLAVTPGTAADIPPAGAVRAVAYSDGMPVARLATWIRDDLHGAPGRSGLVGHFAARDEGSAVAILRDTVHRLLHREGAVRVLGPMNGSTWGRYRLSLPPLQGDPGEPPYLGEPVNPPEYPAWFAAAGMKPVALYESRITRELSASDARIEAAQRTATERGITLAPLDLSAFDESLRELHALSSIAFAGNPYYSPIAEAEFVAQYAPFRSVLDPTLVMLARDGDGVLRGVSFAYPDPLSAVEGRATRVVLKTLAVDPTLRSMGLGGLLVARTHEAAAARGHDAVIHALMHVANHSLRISSHSAGTFRRYALFGVTTADAG